VIDTRGALTGPRPGKQFDQHGVKVYRMNAEGRIGEFWALMPDTVAFDEFFA
jgi:hypothetical protein